jgi:hypothetical protein
MKKPKKINKPKLYACIAKVGNNPDGSAKCVKHRVSNLEKYALYLDGSFPDWRWFNVYSNVGQNKGNQLSSFTKNSRPGQARL